MNMIDVLGPSSSWTRGVLAMGLDVALKAAAMGLFAVVLHALAGRRRPLLRSVLWNACLVGLLVLPASVAAFPRLQVACLPGPSAEHPAAPMSDRPPVEPAGVEAPAPIDPVPLPGPTAPRFDAGRAVVFLYLAVAAVLALRLFVSMAAVEALRRASEPVEGPGWVAALGQWRGRLGLTRAVRLARSGKADVPLVVGWLRPMIVLPERLAVAAEPKAIDAVILHELAHVRRGDIAWNLVLRVVQVLYWPHPIAWFLGRIIGGVREQACDDLCIYWMGDARDYRATLLDVASGLARRRPWQALGLAMARSSKLGRRIAQIDRSRGTPRCLLRGPARLSIAAGIIAACGVLGTVQLARRAAAAQAPAPKPAEVEKKAETDEPKPPAEGKKDEAPETPKVRTVHPKRVDLEIQSLQVYTLQAFEPAAVHARVAGLVRGEGLAGVGDPVKKDQVLAEIDARELRGEVEKARALVEQAMARRSQAEAAVQVAEAAIEGNQRKLSEAEIGVKQAENEIPALQKKVKREEQLFKTGALDVSAVEATRDKLEAAESALTLARARVDTARAALAQSKAERAVADAGRLAARLGASAAENDSRRVEEMAGFTRIVSPIDGIVTRRNVQPDAPVRPGEGPPLFIIARTDVITAVTLVPEQDVPLVDRGDPATVRIYANIVEGKVSRTAYEIDPASRTLRVEIDIPNATGKLRPGMSGTATIVLDVHPKALVIPGGAVDQFGRGSCTRVVNGRTVNTPIQLGRVNNRQGWEVLEGLSESDEVIVVDRDQMVPPQPAFEDGTRVEAVPFVPDKPQRPGRRR